MITEIIAAGAMGVSVFFCIKAHSLLKDEQAKDNPRPSILRSIYVFMGFALLMTPVALGIEYARHQMNLDNVGNDQAGFAEVLQDLADEGHYAVDTNGTPETLNLTFAGVDYRLARPFPAEAFSNTHLKLKLGESGRYLALKNNNSGAITYGYFTADDLKRDLNDLLVIVNEEPEEPVDDLLESKKLMATGLMFAPRTNKLTQVQNKLSANPRTKTTNRYLLDFASSSSSEDPMQKEALSLLVDQKHLEVLDSNRSEQLIELLNTDGVRELPYRYYELAQVYWSRWANYHDTKDLDEYGRMFCNYAKSYESRSWLTSDTVKYVVEYNWYKEAQGKLAKYRCDDDCNCSRRN